MTGTMGFRNRTYRFELSLRQKEVRIREGRSLRSAKQEMQPHHSSNSSALVASAGGGFLPDQVSGATRENGTTAQSTLSPRAARDSANELQPLQVLHRSLRGH